VLIARPFLAAVAALVSIGSTVAPPVAQQAASAADAFDVQKVVDGVFVAIRKDPIGLTRSSNCVFIVNDADVVVVDTGASPGFATATLAALRKITPKPVTHVINTHWHDDHVLGNQVFRAAFSDVKFVGHARNEQQMATTGAATRKQTLDVAPQITRQFQVALEQGKSLLGTPLSDEERRSYLGDIAAWERMRSDLPGVTIVPPTVTIEDKLVLTRGKRTIEVLYFGAGHTGEDLVVRLPQEKVIITGDLVSSPIPLIGSSSHPAEFGATLDKLLALQPSILIPGHGPILKDLEPMRLEIRLVNAIAEQVRAAVARGLSLDDTRKAVNFSEHERAFAGDSPLLKYVFSFAAVNPGVSAAYRDATTKRQ
jgi:glyoxylase-like metal-dependent hydrolase (beta-lactamase superfamily II)